MGFPEGNPAHSPSETNPQTEPCNTFVANTEQDPSATTSVSTTLSPGFLKYFIGLPETNLRDVPVREGSEPGSAGCSSWPSTAFPASDLGGQEEHVLNHDAPATLSIYNSTTFWSLRKGQEVTNGAAQGTRDFLYRNSYLNLIQKGITEPIQRKATLEFLCKKLGTQGLLKHLITNVHLLFISPI